MIVRWTQRAKDDIVPMLEDGASAREIAERFGYTRNQVVGVVHRDKRLSEIGFKNKPGWSAPRAAFIAANPAAPKPEPKKIGRPAKSISIADHRKKNVRGGKPAKVIKLAQPEPKPAPVFVAPDADAYDATARKVALLDLKALDCKWYVGDPLQAGGGFCGHTRMLPHSYCPAHARRAYPGLFICAEAA